MKKKLIQTNNLNRYRHLFLLLKNSTLLTMPSLAGILLALFAIPIHLQLNGKVDYGNYIFFHFIIFFGLLLNLGINKIITITVISKNNLFTSFTVYWASTFNNFDVQFFFSFFTKIK